MKKGTIQGTLEHRRGQEGLCAAQSHKLSVLPLVDTSLSRRHRGERQPVTHSLQAGCEMGRPSKQARKTSMARSWKPQMPAQEVGLSSKQWGTFEGLRAGERRDQMDVLDHPACQLCRV